MFSSHADLTRSLPLAKHLDGEAVKRVEVVETGRETAWIIATVEDVELRFRVDRDTAHKMASALHKFAADGGTPVGAA